MFQLMLNMRFYTNQSKSKTCRLDCIFLTNVKQMGNPSYVGK